MSTIPSTDAVFRRVVERAAARADATSSRALAERLRPVFPRVAVFERQLSGELSHLYVYRDGAYVAEHVDPWWEAADVACVCVSVTTGRLTEVSAEWASLMGADASDLVGRHYTEFVLPEAVEVATALFDALRDQRVVDTSALVRRADGTTIAIDLHATQEDGEIDVSYRVKA